MQDIYVPFSCTIYNFSMFGGMAVGMAQKLTIRCCIPSKGNNRAESSWLSTHFWTWCFFNDIQELSMISAPWMHRFFHEFSKRCHDVFYPIHVNIPQTLEELTRVDSIIFGNWNTGGMRIH